MRGLFSAFLKKPQLVCNYGVFERNARVLSTGICKEVENNVSLNPMLLPIQSEEREVVFTQWNLLLPKPNELKKSLVKWAQNVKNCVESVDYAVLVSNGMNRSRLILSTVRLSTSDSPSSADKLSGASTGLSSTQEEIHKKWAVLKEKLPAWQDNIASQLQRLQDYINKKIGNVSDKKS